MEEFVENFQEFREWINNEYASMKSADYGMYKRAFGVIIDKMEELGLNNVF